MGKILEKDCKKCDYRILKRPNEQWPENCPQCGLYLHFYKQEKPQATKINIGDGREILDRPPLGLKPEKIWIELRVHELTDAIKARAEAGLFDAHFLTWSRELTRRLIELEGLK